MAIDGDLWLQYASASNFTSLEAGELTLYPESHEVFIAQENVRCSRTQFRLLAKLLSEFCKTVSYEQMMETQGRPLSASEHNLLKVEVCNLRRLLRKHGARLEIRNVYGQGYQARPSRQKV